MDTMVTFARFRPAWIRIGLEMALYRLYAIAVRVPTDAKVHIVIIG